ncbi:MAG: hypothetical protein HS119_00755 [Flavobacteriales bacterium]|nr:hypothetical protein [Flavobacteriales bacterium]
MRTIKYLYFLFFCLFLAFYSSAQEKNDTSSKINEVYTTYWGIKNNKPYPLDTDFTVKFQNNKILVIENFYNKNSGEKTPIMDIYNLFSIRFNGDYYYHMGNYREKTKDRVFVKFDLIGDYCVFVIAPSDLKLDSTHQYNDRPNITNEVATGFFAAGLMGGFFVYMIQDFNQANEPYFINDQNEKVNLYYIDTKKSTNYKRMNYNKFKKVFYQETDLHQKMRKNELNVKEVIELFRKK